MSQLVACRTTSCAILAADRRVEVQDPAEPRVELVQKLFTLGPMAAMGSSGAAVGITITEHLARLLDHRAPLPFDELEQYAISVFRQRYEEFIRRGEAWYAAHPEAHRLSYVLLGGIEADGSPALRFYASEALDEPHHALTIGPVLTAPRRLGLETQLMRALATGAEAEELEQLIAEGLERIAQRDPSIKSPFDIARCTHTGASLKSFPSEESTTP